MHSHDAAFKDLGFLPAADGDYEAPREPRAAPELLFPTTLLLFQPRFLPLSVLFAEQRAHAISVNGSFDKILTIDGD